MARQRDRVASIANPYALLSLEIAQEINSLEVITEINPFEIVEIFGEIRGAWGKWNGIYINRYNGFSSSMKGPGQ